MRKIKLMDKIFGIALVLVVVGVMINSRVVDAELSGTGVIVDTVVSVDGPDMVAKGSDFVADVAVGYVENFDSCGFDVTYNETIITVTNVTGGEIGGHTIPMDEWHYIPVSSPVDTGRIRVIAILPGAPAPGVTGTGYIAQIHYHVLGSPGQISAVHLESVGMYDYQAKSIATTTEDDSVQVSQPATAVTVEPASKEVGIGDTFTVDVSVNPDTQIAGVQFSLSFSPSVVTANSVTEGNLLKQGGATTYFQAGTINNGAGTITGVAGAITTPGASVSSQGTFATINFTAVATGTSALHLNNVIVGDRQGQSVVMTVGDGSVTVIAYPDWDVNLDLSVNVLDMILVGQNWGQAGTAHWIREDVNRDGAINVLDMIVIGQHWTA